MIRIVGFTDKLRRHPDQTQAAVAHHTGMLLRNIHTKHPMIAEVDLNTLKKYKRSGIYITISMSTRGQYGTWTAIPDTQFLVIVLSDEATIDFIPTRMQVVTIELANPDSLSQASHYLRKFVRLFDSAEVKY